MKKIVRRLATAGLSVTVAAGALLTVGGTATAATPRAAGHTLARSAVAGDAQVVGVHRYGSPAGVSGYAGERADHRFDPWVAGQLAMIDPWIAGQLAALETGFAGRPAAIDPWIAGQLAQFAPAGSDVHGYAAADGYSSVGLPSALADEGHRS